MGVSTIELRCARLDDPAGHRLGKPYSDLPHKKVGRVWDIVHKRCIGYDWNSKGKVIYEGIPCMTGKILVLLNRLVKIGRFCC